LQVISFLSLPPLHLSTNASNIRKSSSFESSLSSNSYSASSSSSAAPAAPAAVAQHASASIAVAFCSTTASFDGAASDSSFFFSSSKKPASCASSSVEAEFYGNAVEELVFYETLEKATSWSGRRVTLLLPTNITVVGRKPTTVL
jgi:hypothetical protein